MAVVFFTNGFVTKEGWSAELGTYAWCLKTGKWNTYGKLNWATHTVEARNMNKISIPGAYALYWEPSLWSLQCEAWWNAFHGL